MKSGRSLAWRHIQSPKALLGKGLSDSVYRLLARGLRWLPSCPDRNAFIVPQRGRIISVGNLAGEYLLFRRIRSFRPHNLHLVPFIERGVNFFQELAGSDVHEHRLGLGLHDQVGAFEIARYLTDL